MLPENIKKKSILFPLLSCLITFSLYFIEFQPGFFSWDALWRISKFENQFRFSDWTSYLYHISLYMHFKIDLSMKTIAIAQMLLATFSICKLFQFVYSYSSKKLAYVIVLLMLLNPNIALSTLWIHRSSLFGWVFFLNIILLYKLFKAKKWSKAEVSYFLLSITLLLALRRDGIIIAAFSFFSFFKLSHANIKYKSIFLSLGLLILIFLTLAPHLSSSIQLKGQRYSLTAFIYPIKRIQISKNIDFQPEDKKVFNAVLRKKENIEKWFDPSKRWIPLTIFNSAIPKTDLYKFYLWSLKFIINNFPTLLKTQLEVFYSSSFITQAYRYYYYNLDNKTRKEDFPKIHKRYLIKREMNKIPPLRKVQKSLSGLASSDHRSFINIFLSGVAVPFLITFTFILVAFIYKKTIFYILLPTFIYNTYFFLLQPLPKGYYWYYLALLSYFIIFAIGYDLFKSINLSRKSIVYDTKASQ